MELIEAIKIRHSVRNFTDEPVAQEIIDGLKSLAEQYNQAAGLHIQIVTDDPEAFTKGMAHYGKFSGVRNYIALVGGKTGDLEEKLGYFGEKIALSLTLQDIQFCWVGLTFSKKTNRVEVRKGEKYVGVICFVQGVHGKGIMTMEQAGQVAQQKMMAIKSKYMAQKEQRQRPHPAGCRRGSGAASWSYACGSGGPASQ